MDTRIRTRRQTLLPAREEPLVADALLFDLDGTLADTVGDLHGAVAELFGEMDLPAPSLEAVRDMVGNGARHLLVRALQSAGAGDLPQRRFEQAFERFMVLYGEHNGEQALLFPGTAGALRTLYAAGYPLAVVTNKPQRFVAPLLQRLGIGDCFAVLVGGDTLPQRKPQPEPLWHACRQLGVAPARALMVGDSAIDIEAARAAGCRVACVGYGYHHGIDLEALGVPLLPTLAALPALLPPHPRPLSPSPTEHRP